MTARRALTFALALLAPTAAFAHGAGDHVHSLADGLLHPVFGADHLLAMVAVGAMAARIGGRALMAVPAGFVAAMAAGAALGMAGTAVPGVEGLIALSLVVVGAALAVAGRLPAAGAVALAALAGLVHGNAHGLEIPAAAPGLAFAAGALAATAALHGAGALAASRLAAHPRLITGFGAATGLFGALALLATG